MNWFQLNADASLKFAGAGRGLSNTFRMRVTIKIQVNVYSAETNLKP